MVDGKRSILTPWNAVIVVIVKKYFDIIAPNGNVEISLFAFHSIKPDRWSC